jgi:hypothetical protein
MKKGGNAAARTFFTSHGVTATDMGRAETKYHCRAAEMYKTHIKKVIIKITFVPAVYSYKLLYYGLIMSYYGLIMLRRSCFS